MSLDILAMACVAVASGENLGRNPEHQTSQISDYSLVSLKTRAACHRCGNMRKLTRACPSPDCPHIFCSNCQDKVEQEHSDIRHLFEHGCAVCLGLCCCAHKSELCQKMIHCYRKCPVSKIQSMNEQQLKELLAKRRFSSQQIFDIKQQKLKKPRGRYASRSTSPSVCFSVVLGKTLNVFNNETEENNAIAENRNLQISCCSSNASPISVAQASPKSESSELMQNRNSDDNVVLQRLHAQQYQKTVEVHCSRSENGLVSGHPLETSLQDDITCTPGTNLSLVSPVTEPRSQTQINAIDDHAVIHSADRHSY